MMQKSLIIFFWGVLIYSIDAFGNVPNILLISIDSFNRDIAYQKNFNPNYLPTLNRITNNGYIFSNCFTENPWSNIGMWISKIPPDLYSSSRMATFGQGWKISSLKKFGGDKIDFIPGNFYFLIPNDLNGYEISLNLLKNRFVSAEDKTKPYFLNLHIKDLHPPYFIPGRTNPSELSTDSKTLLIKYLKHPKDFPEKAVLFSLLFDEQLRLHHSRQTLIAINELVRKKILSESVMKLRYLNLPGSLEALEAWKKSIDFNKDLYLLKELYLLKLRLVDITLDKILNIVEYEKRKNNTLLIIVSNFGLALFEHDNIFNAVDTFDEFIGTHLFIRPPEINKLIFVKNQATLRGVGRFVRSVLEGEKVSDKNIKLAHEPLIISKNYMEDRLSIREENKWKFVIDLVNLKRSLFDLQFDPYEKHNLIDSNSTKALQLESELLKNLFLENSND